MTTENEEFSRAYKFGLLAPIVNADAVYAQLRGAHRYYNALVEIERWKQGQIDRFWAERGGYTDKLDRLAELNSKVRETPKNERKPLYEEIDALRKEIWEARRAAQLEAAETPEERRRKERAAELRAQAKAEKRKLSKEELTALLDADPECVSPRDRVRIAYLAECKAAGKKLHPPTLAKRLREAGIVSPVDDIEQEAKKRDYEAYQAQGISHGTRALVTAAFNKAVDDSAKRYELPRFRSWEEARTSIGVVFQRAHEFRCADMLNGSSRWARIEVDPNNDRKALLYIRIGSEENGDPIWAVFPMVYELKLPPEGLIGMVRVKRERVGLHDRWSAIVLCSVPATYRVPVPVERGGAVAVDLAWRRLPSGAIRCGYWCDERGNHGSIELPYRVSDRLAKVRSLESIISRQIYWSNKITGEEGGIVIELAKWLYDHRDSLPDWLMEHAPYIRKWRSGHRLARLVEHWLQNRFDGDEDMLGARDPDERADIVARLSRTRWKDDALVLEGERVLGPLDMWRRRWRHLVEWAENQHASTLRYRDECMRIEVNKLTRAYDTIVVRGLDVAKMKERKPGGDGLQPLHDNVASVMTIASPGKLREELARSAKARNRVFVKVEESWFATTCHACGSTCEWDRAKHLRHQCERCGAEWDQHHNIAMNMLSHYRERLGGGKSTGPARKAGKGAKRRVKTDSSASAVDVAE